jgi:menaquinone-dependent protoporphyrinogen oxidase
VENEVTPRRRCEKGLSVHGVLVRSLVSADSRAQRAAAPVPRGRRSRRKAEGNTMAKVLIVYGTTEGHTAKVAQHIGDIGLRLGHQVSVAHAPDVSDGDLKAFDAVIVGASLHEGRYQRAVRDFVDRHKAFLTSHPSAFFSVSLAAASHDPDERAEARRIAEEFVSHTGWTPNEIASFAGALKYTQYSWFKRAVMKHIAAQEGGDVDTSQDFEYTDWADVALFADGFFGKQLA